MGYLIDCWQIYMMKNYDTLLALYQSEKAAVSFIMWYENVSRNFFIAF